MPKKKRRKSNSTKAIAGMIAHYVNQSRTKRGLGELKRNRGLFILSAKHSARMAKVGKIWHGDGVHKAKSFIYVGWWNKLKRGYGFWAYLLAPFYFLTLGGSGFTGENVAMMPKGRVKGYKRPISSDKDIARALHRSWMNSPGHKRNILNSNFSMIGVGVKRKGNRFYATQIFYG